MENKFRFMYIPWETIGAAMSIIYSSPDNISIVAFTAVA